MLQTTSCLLETLIYNCDKKSAPNASIRCYHQSGMVVSLLKGLPFSSSCTPFPLGMGRAWARVKIELRAWVWAQALTLVRAWLFDFSRLGLDFSGLDPSLVSTGPFSSSCCHSVFLDVFRHGFENWKINAEILIIWDTYPFSIYSERHMIS